MTDETPTHFGFETVTADQKTRQVIDVFRRVAGSYDLMNNVMSLGIHHIWKSTLIDLMRPRDHIHLLDIAGGTGDIAIKFLKRCQNLGFQHTYASVCDLNPSMVTQGRDKAIDLGAVKNLDWVVGDAMHLPYENNKMDMCSIAFGLRNVTYPQQALEQAWRVLKPGGTFYCLEFSKVQNSFLKKIYNGYSFKIIPKLGQFIAGDQAAYQYLVESIQLFPDAPTLQNMMNDFGFRQTSYQLLNDGIAAIHIGVK